MANNMDPDQAAGFIVFVFIIRSSLVCSRFISRHHFQDKILACLGKSILACSCLNQKDIYLIGLQADWLIRHDFVMAIPHDLSSMHECVIRINSSVIICNA